MKRIVCVVAAALAVLAHVSPAWAEPRPLDVSVEVGAGIETKVLEGHLAVELEPTTAPQKVEIARQGASLRVRLAYSDGSEERLTVDVTDVADDAAPRVLALAIGEAARLHVARSERLPPAPLPAPLPPPRVVAPAPPPDVPLPSTREPAVRALLSTSIGARVFSAAGSLGVEPRLAFGLAHRSGFIADIGVSYLTAGASDTLGDVRLHTIGASLGAGYELALSSRVRVRGGPRLDVGAAFGSGTANANANANATRPALASSTSAPLASLVGEVVVSVRLGARQPWLLLALDAGGVLRGLDLRADDRTALAALGGSFGGRLGIGFR